MRQRIKSLKIGVDLDGVIADSLSVAAKMIKKRFGVDICKIMKKRKAVDYWFVNWPELKAIDGFADFITQIYKEPYVYQKAKPISGAVSFLKKWHQQGHLIWILTARPKKFEMVTLDWLKKYDFRRFIKKDKIWFHQTSDHFSSQFKPLAVEKVGLRVFIMQFAEAVAF